MLLRSWLAQAEKTLPGLFPARQPSCLVALEKEKLIAFAIVKPYNRRGSCWSVSVPELLVERETCDTRSVHLSLLENALKLGNSRVQGWIIRCPASNTDFIDMSRELGFQPLKIFKCWSPRKVLSTNSNKGCLKDLPHGLEWQQLKRGNAPLLWQLEKASESSHLRQILDRQWADLLDQNQVGSGVLTTDKEEVTTAIAGLISRTGTGEELILELLRDFAWDSRLTSTLPIVIKNIINITNLNDLTIETASEDDHLTNVFEQLGWEQIQEKILLGRSLWRRQVNSRLMPGTKQIESMFGRLQPQRPPLPTPSLEQH